MKTTTSIQDGPSRMAGLADLSRSIARLDVAGLAGLTTVAAGAVVLKKRAHVSRSSVFVALSALTTLGTLILRLGSRSGTTDEEARGTLPGDDVIP